MSYLLDIKQDLLVTTNGGIIISNQLLAINTRFSLVYSLYLLWRFFPLPRDVSLLFTWFLFYAARPRIYSLTSFTYTLGVGVQKPISEHWQMGVGYEFADWGKSELGRALGQMMNLGLASITSTPVVCY